MARANRVPVASGMEDSVRAVIAARHRGRSWRWAGRGTARSPIRVAPSRVAALGVANALGLLSAVMAVREVISVDAVVRPAIRGRGRSGGWRCARCPPIIATEVAGPGIANALGLLSAEVAVREIVAVNAIIRAAVRSRSRGRGKRARECEHREHQEHKKQSCIFHDHTLRAIISAMKPSSAKPASGQSGGVGVGAGVAAGVSVGAGVGVAGGWSCTL